MIIIKKMVIIKNENQYLGGAVKRKKPKHAGVSTICLKIWIPKFIFYINNSFSFSLVFYIFLGMTNLKAMKNRPMILIGG